MSNKLSHARNRDRKRAAEMDATTRRLLKLEQCQPQARARAARLRKLLGLPPNLARLDLDDEEAGE